MFVLNVYFRRELRFVAILRSKLRILLRNSEEKIGGWGLWLRVVYNLSKKYVTVANEEYAVPGYCADNILLEKRLSAAFL